MDVTLTSSGPMAVIGVGTVFLALLTLVFVISAVARLSRSKAGGARSEEPEGLGSSAAAQGPDAAGDLRLAALAAYAVHLGRRARARPAATAPISRWAVAGRIRQTAPFQR